MSEGEKYFGWTVIGIDTVNSIPQGGVRETLFYKADADREGLRRGEIYRIITSMQLENKLFGRRIKHSLEKALESVKSSNNDDFFVCPFLVIDESHEIGLIVTKNSIEIFDTGYGDKNRTKLIELYKYIKKNMEV